MVLRVIGALWKGKSGSKAVLSGHMDGPDKKTRGPKVFVFPNEKATPENRQPQYRICVEDGEPAPTNPNTTHNLSDEETPF